MAGSLLPHIVPGISDSRLEYIKYSNLLYNLYQRRSRHVSMVSRPFELTIDTTTICQLSCPYCTTGNKSVQRARQVMTADNHSSYLSPLADTCFLVWYFSNGEPLLNKKLPEIIKQYQDRDIYSIISTNLSIELSDNKILELLHCGLNVISVSLDGASEETYRKYRRGGNFSLVVRNMKRLLTMKKALGLTYPLILWRFLLFDHNADDVPLVLENAKNWEVDLLEFFTGSAPASSEDPDAVLKFTGEYPSSNYNSPVLEKLKMGNDSFYRKYLAENSPVPTGKGTAPELKAGKCDWLYFSTMIYPDGDTGPCCVIGDEKYDFGNIKTDSFEKTWNNQKYQSARSYLQGSDVDDSLICKKCPHPKSKDYQFRNSLKAYFLNAPEWFIKAVASDPEKFIDPMDITLSPDIFSPFLTGNLTSKLGKYGENELDKILETIKTSLSADKFDVAGLQAVLT